MTKFTSEDKLLAVKRYLEGKGSHAYIGESIGANKSEVMNWVRQYDKDR